MKSMDCFGFFSWVKKAVSSKDQESSWWGSDFGKGSQQTKQASASLTSSSSQSQPISFVSTSSADSVLLEIRDPKWNSLRVFKFSELKFATNNFGRGNYLGEGGFGCVYKGLIEHPDFSQRVVKLNVAVKQLNPRGQQGYQQWLTEVKYLERVNHPNLVKLLGYCVEDYDRGLQMLLVYEFIPNNSLEAHLFGKHLPVLSWERRLQIALGVAQGLQYLHDLLDFQIIFRDLKPSNILLDNDYMPKISDFGLAREGPDANHSHVSTQVVGTMGYASPEYLQTGHLNAKSDIWSYGILLLELLTGRKAMNDNLPRNEQLLVKWVEPYIGHKKKFTKIIDPRLDGQYNLNSVKAIASLACQCTSKVPKSRPKMKEVVESLRKIVELPCS